MNQILEILGGASWWVYVLFVYFVSIGISARKPRKMSFKKLIVLPIVFVGFSFYTLYDRFISGDPSLIVVWLLALCLGASLGAKEVYNWKIVIDRKKRELTIPGNNSTLVLIVLIFAVNFFWGYWYATHPTADFWTYFWNACTSGVISGFFVGRAWIFFRRFSKDCST